MNFWTKYQEQARSTAIYPNKGSNLLYPTLGLIGETGEIADKLKKILRGDGTTFDHFLPEDPLDFSGKCFKLQKSQLSHEIGDVLWYIANICCELKFELSDLFENLGDYSQEPETNIYRGILVYQREINIVSQNANILINTPNNNRALQEIYLGLHNIIVHLHGMAWFSLKSDLKIIAENNIAKLLDRKQRDVLQGSGDNR